MLPGRPDFEEANKNLLLSMCKEIQKAKKANPSDPYFSDPELKQLDVEASCEDMIAPAHNMMSAMKGVPSFCDREYATSLIGQAYPKVSLPPPTSPREDARELYAQNLNCASVCTNWTLGQCAYTCGSAVAKCFYGNYFGCAKGVLACAQKARTCCTCGCRARLYYCGVCGYRV